MKYESIPQPSVSGHQVALYAQTARRTAPYPATIYDANNSNATTLCAPPMTARCAQAIRYQGMTKTAYFGIHAALMARCSRFTVAQTCAASPVKKLMRDQLGNVPKSIDNTHRFCDTDLVSTTTEEVS